MINHGHIYQGKHFLVIPSLHLTGSLMMMGLKLTHMVETKEIGNEIS